MGHYAKVVDGTVVRVLVAREEFFKTFVDRSPGEWLKTSYNTRGGVHYNPETGLPSDDQSKALRYNYAGVGFGYDGTYDAFYPPKPAEGWTLNRTTFRWDPPPGYGAADPTHETSTDGPTNPDDSGS